MFATHSSSWLARSLATLLLPAALFAAADRAEAIRSTPDPADPYRQVRIPWSVVQTRPAELALMEVMKVERGQWFEFLARNAEIEALGKAGIPFEVVVQDLEAEYERRLEADQEGGLRGGGNFGIFHTYSETVQFLDALHASYPSITTSKIQLGTTWEGRAIWAMKISDNPNMEEPGEPEVLFDGVHHAREIMTVEVVLSYMEYLCQGYGVDDEATQLVDSRQIWFVPIVNADGFVYNETTNPAGGGLWRKNRRNDLGACIGVDPNRNYPYQWGGEGASPDPCDETHRGPSAGSEAEIQAMMSFIEDHEFVTHNSYHSVVGAIIFPWAYTTVLSPDDAKFRQIAGDMARDSGYANGTVWEILAYLASGGFFDWTYGDTTNKPSIVSFTTEIGGSGFWPAESERAGLIAENHWSNVYLTRAAGVFLLVESAAVLGGDANGRLDPGETVDLVVTVQNGGVLADAAGVTMTLASDDPYIALGDAAASVGAIPALGSADNAGDPFVLSAAAGTPPGWAVDLQVTLTEASGYSTTETISLTVGQAPVILSENFEAGSGWTQDPSHNATTGAFVRIDPNATGWQPGDDTTPDPGVFAWITAQNSSEGVNDVDNGVAATRSPIVDLSGRQSVQLSMSWFHGQRDAGGDGAGDFFRIDLSNNGGATYPANLVALGDVTSPAVWHTLNVDLEDYLPLTASMRIRVQAADGVAIGDIVEAGVDDVFFLDGGSGNEAPGAPLLVSPPDGAIGQPSQPQLTVSNATDPESDALTYTFRVYADALLTQQVAAVSGVSEGTGTTSWTVSPGLAEGTYHWRAHAADAELSGPYMASASFTVGEATGALVQAASAHDVLLAAPRPNPFSNGTDVVFTLPKRTHVRIDVFDTAGRHVRRLFTGVADAGLHTRPWDGLDGGGRRVAGGVYYVQLVVEGQRHTQKTVRLP
jgi:hypothetical protein